MGMGQLTPGTARLPQFVTSGMDVGRESLNLPQGPGHSDLAPVNIWTTQNGLFFSSSGGGGEVTGERDRRGKTGR